MLEQALEGHEGSMKDIQTHLDKIRSDAAECLLISTLVGDGKREVFAKTAQHLNALASEVEKTIATNNAEMSTRGESEHMARAGDSEEPVVTDVPVAHHKQARPRRMLPWLLVVVVGGIVGAFLWASNPAKTHWSLFALQSKHEAPPAPQDETKQAIAALLSGEQAERKILMEQVSGLGARLDDLARALDNLKTSRTEIPGPSNKDSIGAEEKPPAAQTAPSAPEEKPIRKDENPTYILESPALARQPVGAPRATDSPLVEPADQVGAIPVPARRAGLDQRKATIGPAGCTQFRSFDPVSGTYTTLDGRRRQCR
jgi:BA14K-like protein